MYVEFQLMHIMALEFMLKDRKNLVVWYRSFLDTLYLFDFKHPIISKM